MQHRAIETRYKGYRFRSRLEARWAVFFDALGIRWEYEPEGFELPGGVRYLPDFRLFDVMKHNHRQLYAEVKPSRSADDGKALLFSAMPTNDWSPLVLLLDGPPDETAYGIASGGHITSFGVVFWQKEDGVTVLANPMAGENVIGAETYIVPGVRSAIYAARGARFEFADACPI